MERKIYADVWGDTVNLKHLAIAMLIGIVLSLSSFILGLDFIHESFPKLPKNLNSSYALLIGILGCLLSAVISANLFKAKRVLNQNEFLDEDRNALLEELQIDREKEADELKTVGPQMVEEMKQLQLYDLFARKDENRKGAE